jgi:two-component system nitrogen regulation response regulator GlnG
LENICHWLTVMAPAQTISVQDLPPEVLEAPSATTDPLLATSPVAESAAEPLPAVAAPVPVAGVSAVAHRPVAVPPGSLSPLAAHPLVDGADATAWEQALEREAQGLLAAGQNDIWDVLAHRFESRLIRTALAATHGRRMEAAQRLGIGRNTITRKIQELGLDGVDEPKNGHSA